MVMSPDDKFLALYGFSYAEVHIFNLKSGQLYAKIGWIGVTERSITYFSFRSDSKQVVFLGDNGEVELWHLGSRARVWRADIRSLSISATGSRVAFSPQNDLVAWLNRSQIGLLDAISGEVVVKLRSSSRWDQIDIAWAGDGMRLLTSDKAGKVCVWDVASARSAKKLHLLFEYDTKYPTASCSFFDSHRCILTDHGLFPIPLQYRPPCAVDDRMPPSPEKLLRLRDDGWILLVGREIGERRVCWLPPAYRPVQPTLNKNIVILRDGIRLVSDSGRLVFIDLKTWF